MSCEECKRLREKNKVLEGDRDRAREEVKEYERLVDQLSLDWEATKPKIEQLGRVVLAATAIAELRHEYVSVGRFMGGHPGNDYWKARFLAAYKPLEESLGMEFVTNYPDMEDGNPETPEKILNRGD